MNKTQRLETIKKVAENRKAKAASICADVLKKLDKKPVTTLKAVETAVKQAAKTGKGSFKVVLPKPSKMSSSLTAAVRNYMELRPRTSDDVVKAFTKHPAKKIKRLFRKLRRSGIKVAK